MKSKNPKTKSVKLSGMKGCTVNFAGAVPTDNEGTNGDYSKEFSIIENLVMSNYVGHTVDLNTFVQLSKSLNLPYIAVMKGFERFIQAALKDGRAKEIHSCYETAVYEIIG